MKAREKIGYTLELIDTARQLSAKGSKCWIDHNSIDKKKLTPIELHSILSKLEQDEKIIEITESPFSDTIELKLNDDIPRMFQLKVKPKFDKYFENFYIEDKLDFEKLSGTPFLRVYDVMLDLDEELAMSKTNSVTIPIMRHLLRFPILCPADTPQFRNEYCDARWKAAKYLKDIEILVDAEIPSKQNWQSKINATVKDRRHFDKAMTKMREMYVDSPTGKQSMQKLKEAVKRGNEKKEKENPKLRLNTKRPKPLLTFGENQLLLDKSTVEYYILKELFEKHPNHALDDDVIEAWGGQEKKQTLYDASRRLNKKLNKLTGLEGNLVSHSNSKFWFDDAILTEVTKSDSD